MPFYLIDKPSGPTSHDIVDQVRRKTGERRVGHAGTLDPFASGLLIVAVGRESTKEISKFVGLDKVYEATFVLGATSDTDDRMGKITPVPIPTPPSLGGGSQGGGFEEKIKAAINKFIGKIEQIPPDYAAIKIGGKKMYEAAREGKPLEAKPRPVTIFEFNLIEEINLLPYPPTPIPFKVKIHCSSGTYIRALARDLGQELGTGGYVSELRRISIGNYNVKDAKPL